MCCIHRRLEAVRGSGHTGNVGLSQLRDPSGKAEVVSHSLGHQFVFRDGLCSLTATYPSVGSADHCLPDLTASNGMETKTSWPGGSLYIR